MIIRKSRKYRLHCLTQTSDLTEGLGVILGGAEEQSQSMCCANNSNISKAWRKVLKAKYWLLAEKQRTMVALINVPRTRQAHKHGYNKQLKLY